MALISLGQPSTTYTNDPIGLTQLLLADDGTTTTANLFGLDLILQQKDDGNPLSAYQPLYLLTDGLGSVRVEMTGGNATATTSYGPYGSIHQQTGTSQTSYGYTGEQFHAGTGLLYLRARYYSPALHAFTSRDPWEGDAMRPVTLNGYNYANANPVFYVDPTGEAAVPIVWCFGIAIAIPDPGIAEGACALFAAGVIGVTWVAVGPDAARQIADDVVDMADHIAQQCIDIVERAFVEPDPEPEYKVDLLPIPMPNDRPIEKHISLGFNNVGNKTPLWDLTFRLNLQLNPQGIYVYSYGGIDPQQGGWFENGLSSVTPLANFSQAFDEATQNASHIHFTLEGITNSHPRHNVYDPIQFIQAYGGDGDFNKGEFITAVELYRIKHNGLCDKTTFYENNLKSPSAWHRICTR